MPRKTTQLGSTRRYLKASAWITDIHAPLVTQLENLARTLDAQITGTGEVQAATASAYQRAMKMLLDERPTNTSSSPDTPSDDGLFGPALVGPDA